MSNAQIQTIDGAQGQSLKGASTEQLLEACCERGLIDRLEEKDGRFNLTVGYATFHLKQEEVRVYLLELLELDERSRKKGRY